MRKRWKLLLAALAGVMLAGGVVAFFTLPRGGERVSRENYCTLKIGMSRGQVVAILGEAGDHASGPVESDVGGVRALPLFKPLAVRIPEHAPVWYWRGDQGTIAIIFDDSDHLALAWFTPQVRVKQTSLENLQWRLKREWNQY